MPLAFPRGAAIGLPVVGSISHLESYQVKIVPHGKSKLSHLESYLVHNLNVKTGFKMGKCPTKIAFAGKVWPAGVCLFLQRRGMYFASSYHTRVPCFEETHSGEISKNYTWLRWCQKARGHEKPLRCLDNRVSQAGLSTGDSTLASKVYR